MLLGSVLAGAVGMGWFGLGRRPPGGEGSSGAPTAPGNGDSITGKAASGSLQSLFEFCYEADDLGGRFEAFFCLLYLMVPVRYALRGQQILRRCTWVYTLLLK